VDYVKKDIKELWATALESGDYEQGTGHLRTRGVYEDTWCCLGVLCDLSVAAGIGEWIQTPGNYVFRAFDKRDGTDGVEWYDYSGAFLPKAVASWAGIDWEEHGGNVKFGEATTASWVNDIEKTPFPGVAVLVREHL
jgi:hypothetical protein